MEECNDSEKKIGEIEKRIVAANEADKIGKRILQAEAPLIELDLKTTFEFLSKTIDEVAENAAELVNQHLNKNRHSEFDKWVSDGQGFTSGTECPFCGQDIQSIDLISAYKAFFSEEYKDLEKRIGTLETAVATSLSDQVIENLVNLVKTNNANSTFWSDSLTLSDPVIDLGGVRESIETLRETLTNLISSKRINLLQAVGSNQDRKKSLKLLSQIKGELIDYNNHVRAVNERISNHQQQIKREDVGKLKSELEKVRKAVKRYTPEIVKHVRDRANASKEKTRLEDEKAEARQKADHEMQTTLTQYQKSINSTLSKFGARVSIEEMKPDYKGGTPRTHFVLHVRNQSVSLQQETSDEHTFSTALSEGDKRTLALSFFLAKLDSDADLGKKIVVLDDPVSSFDRSRRHQTILRILRIAKQCRQLIVLSHDPYFLRDLQDAFAKLATASLQPTVLRISRTGNDYSKFDVEDIHSLCETEYFRQFRILEEFVEGTSLENIRDISKMIRPFIEGNLHRRFPRFIPRNLMLGKIISDYLEPATTPPLSFVHGLVEELREINDYASKYHHDTNPNADSEPLDETEMVSYARRALQVIYQNS